MGKPGRPKLQLDENLIHSLASKGCSNAEIATILSRIEKKKITANVLVAKRSDTLEQGRADMRRSLREAQIALTEGNKPNPVMLIWLGKQYLGQADKVESNNKQLLQIESGEIWKSAFGTTPGRPLPIPKSVAAKPKPSETVQ